ncbi:FtsK/SpoIIIE domain-containing protein [Frigoribacterium sp. UYMn621]|uniref:FtsK/SpoIIIE domain-containing protein n=1 Tax=Frigoribacterium sp. UYMn621 TaxID=3156343 RepID=UPI003395B9D7
MKVRLTLVRPGGSTADVVVTAEPGSTIAEVAHRLDEADPQHPAGIGSPTSLTLRQHRHSEGIEGATILDPAAPLGESGLASGAIVSLAPPTTFAEGRSPVGATLRIVEGLGNGQAIPLPYGSSSIGRDQGNRVTLADPLISKTHARVTVADMIELVDAGSANGTLVNGLPVDRAILTAGDRVTLGDTVLTVEPSRTDAQPPRTGTVHFNRSPRLDPQYSGSVLKAPEPPERPKPPRLPYLALLAPLIMGGVLLAVNPGNPLSIAFIALSPLLLIAGYVDNRIQGRRQWRDARAQFEDSVTAIGSEVARLHDLERVGRLSEAPAVSDVVVGARELTPLLWTRRPEHDSFLALRLGIGRMPSRHELEMPGQRKGPADLWKSLEDLALKTAWIDGVPVTENLRESGSLGVAGEGEGSRAVARGLVAHLVGSHSPAELVLTSICSSLSARGWEWLKWLPHSGSAYSPLSSPPLVTGGAPSLALISDLEGLIEARLAAEENKSVVLPVVLVVVEDDAPVERARLVGIAERGPGVGVHLLWVADSVARIPAACRTFVEVGTSVDGALTGYVRSGLAIQPLACEPLGEADSLDFARRLAPVVDAGARVDDSSDLPRSVSLLQVVGTELGTDTEAVLQRWQETNSILTGPRASAAIGRSRPNLRAVFGQAATEPFALDLRTDGPHALVGGTTGSGKSEFLQAWVLGLASAHSPQRVSFLFVDYKGGSAFAECLDLPHTVGLVTDLSPHLVRRALTSLRAELRYREHLFNRKKVKDIIEMEKLGDPEVPPSLVIIVDEFAALATEVPEFVDGVVDVAQRGRSLGLHLILATQRPAGVIRDNLRANTNLRVALRMADESDSDDVLGTPMAAGFDPALPGRAAAKTGPGRIRVFQSGYAGGWTSDIPAPTEIEVEDLRFGPATAWQSPSSTAEVAAPSGPTDIQRVVKTIKAAATGAELPAPRKPWLPELAPAYDFSKLPSRRTDTELVLGVVDDAAQQAQPTVSYLPDRDGNMAVIGTGGSGKSTALRAVAVSSAITMRGGPVQVYGLDFAAGGLQMLEVLPHVGAIISGDDEERVARLLRWLRDLVDDRAVRYAEARAGGIVDYRRLANRPEEARIILLLDGMGAFREAFESSVTSPWFSVFSQIATDGRAVGVHVVVSGDRSGSIPMSLSSSIQRRLVLRLANADDYAMLGVDSDVLSPASPPGRGILDGSEVQIAVLGGDGNVAIQGRELEALAEAMITAGVPAAPSIERLSDSIPASSLPASIGGKVMIGVADDDLKPVAIEPFGSFVISGPPGSGRTTALETIARGLAAGHPSTKLFLLSTRRSALARIGIWANAADTPASISKAVAELTKMTELGDLVPGTVALFLENLSDFSGTPEEYDLEALIKTLLKQGQFVVAESETSSWAQSYTLGSPMKAGRKGIVLQPDDGDGELLNTSIGRIRRGSFPPGRGFLIGQGRSRRLQVALTE